MKSMKKDILEYRLKSLAGSEESSVATRIIVHSFNRVDKCLHWLSRKEHTTRDCCIRMGELLYHGKSS
jgi:hypothetical protein